MLVFDEGCNRSDLWNKSEGKRVNSAISRQNHTLVPVPLMQWKNGTSTTRSGTDTALQNRFGTGTEQSGTGTTSSCNPCFWYFCKIKL